MNNCPNWAKECCNHAFRAYFNKEEYDVDVAEVINSLNEKDRNTMETVFKNNFKLYDAIEGASLALGIPQKSIFRLVQKTSLKLLIARGCVCGEIPQNI